MIMKFYYIIFISFCLLSVLVYFLSGDEISIEYVVCKELWDGFFLVEDWFDFDVLFDVVCCEFLF